MIRIVFAVLFFIPFVSKSQVNFDFTDSLANQQKQYIIRFDVGNGNIVVPVKKKLVSKFDTSKIFKRDIVRLKPKILIPLYKDTFVDGTKQRILYKLEEIDNPALHGDTDKEKGVRYLVAGRFFKPRVDAFIRMVFENVPKDEDVKVSVDFLDKNLESAATFSNYLNSYANTLGNAVYSETKDSVRAKELVEEQKKNAEKTTEKLQKESNEKLSVGVRDIISKEFGDLKDAAASIKKGINTYNGEVRQGRIITLDSLKSEVDQIENIFENITALKRRIDTVNNAAIRGAVDSITKNLSRSEKVLSNLRASLAGKFKQSAIPDKVITKLESDISILVAKVATVNDRISSVTSAQIARLAETIDSLKKVIIDLDSVNIIRLDSIYNRRVIYIQPIQVANTDLTVINVEYIKIGKSSVRRTIVLKNRAGFKLDFSTGFMGAGLRDRNYRLYSRNDSAAIVEDGRGTFAIGFAFLAHAYVRTGTRFNVAITSGFAINGSNQTVNYLLGGSVPLGLEQRFVVSSGLVFGKVRRLSSGYKAISEGDTLPTVGFNDYFYKGLGNIGVPYTEKWDRSYFIAISYNLGTVIGSSRRSIVAR